MKKLLLIILLCLFLISFTSALSYEQWRNWNGTTTGSYMIGQTGDDRNLWSSMYKYNRSDNITGRMDYLVNTFGFVFQTNSSINDSFGVRVGHEKYKGIKLNITQAFLASNVEIIWEYAQTASLNIWLPLNITYNECGIFNTTGVCQVNFTKPINWSSHLNNIHGAGTGAGGAGTYASGYTIRARLSNFDSVTQNFTIAKEVWVLSDEIIINKTDKVTPQTLYANDTANGWGCITNSSTNSLFYTCDCDINLEGRLDIENGTIFQVGQFGGNTANNNLILMPNITGSFLELGELSNLGYGKQGGTLLYGNGDGGVPYLYWHGTFNVYGSTFIRNGGGYSGWAMGTVSYNWIDSDISSMTSDTIFLSGGTGNILRSNVMANIIQVYTGNLLINGMITISNSIYGTPTSYLYFDVGFGNLNKYDTNTHTGVYVPTHTNLFLTDCNLNLSKPFMYGGTYTNSIMDAHTLKLKVIDINGNPIPNATVRITNNRGISSLYRPNWEKNTRVATTVTMPNLTAQYTTCTPTPCTNNFNIGDKYLRKNEVMTVNNTISAGVYFNRNQTGTFHLDTNSLMDYYSLQIMDNDTTNVNGDLLWETNKSYKLIKTYIMKGTAANGTKTYIEDIQNFSITKDGYADANFSINVSQILGTSWSEPVSLVVTLEEQPDWNYSWVPEFKILNKSKHTIFKITDTGDLAIAGNLYENTNSPPPGVNIIWKIANWFWLDDMGNLYLNKLYALID